MGALFRAHRVCHNAARSCGEEEMRNYAMGSSVRVSTRIAPAVTVIAYGAAVVTVTWATVSNFLGDQIYGRLIMVILALPVSIVDWLVGDMVFNALRGGPADTSSGVLDFIALGWPGIAMAIILAILLMRHRRWLGLVAGWLLTVATFICGAIILLDSWSPRRPWGWPLLAYALIMAVGLIVARIYSLTATGQSRTAYRPPLPQSGSSGSRSWPNANRAAVGPGEGAGADQVDELTEKRRQPAMPSSANG
ncbi:hypothetical protein ACOZ38_29295 [Sphaerisporangium viridialbum]|uniref:hypothetical protein n=1 Tax=Sphaerisporangium viridialbum TaxID=46189 RepID=UPI003C744119